MKLKEILVEHGSANPFVGIVSAIDLRIQEVKTAVSGKSSKIFKNSIESQLKDLMKFLESGSNWIIPEPKLRRDIHEALPIIKKHVSAALVSVNNASQALKHLMTAREITVKRSHLKF